MLHDPKFTASHAANRQAMRDATRHIQRDRREERITVPGQIRLEPLRKGQNLKPTPDRPVRDTGPIIRGAKREHVIKEIARTLTSSRFSPFEFEGACRHGIRSELCLEGYAWSAADLEASVLVTASLHTLHAKRPSYEEGQREHTIPRDYCAWCGSPMDEDGQPGTRMSYCSEGCARSAITWRQLHSHRRETTAYNEAYKVIMRSKNPARECEDCGKTFRPLEVGARFCSKNCVGRAATRYRGTTLGGAALLDDRTCRNCGTGFHPTDAAHVYCSARCRHEGQRIYLHDIECQTCRTLFRPKTPANKFCSLKCRDERHVIPTHSLVCEWCGEAFVTAKPSAVYCSDMCGKTSRRFNLGVRPTKLALHVFDHFVSVPALAAAMGAANG